MHTWTSVYETESIWAFGSTCGVLAETGVGSDFVTLRTGVIVYSFLGREQKPRLVPSCLCILGFQGTTEHYL